MEGLKNLGHEGLSGEQQSNPFAPAGSRFSLTHGDCPFTALDQDITHTVMCKVLAFKDSALGFLSKQMGAGSEEIKHPDERVKINAKCWTGGTGGKGVLGGITKLGTPSPAE